MHQEDFELRRSHKQNEVGSLLLPLSHPNIFIDLEKPPHSSSTAINIQLSAHDEHSGSACSQARSTLQEADNAV